MECLWEHGVAFRGCVWCKSIDFIIQIGKSKNTGKEVGTMQVQIEVKEKKKDQKRMEQYLKKWKKKGGHKHAGC